VYHPQRVALGFLNDDLYSLLWAGGKIVPSTGKVSIRSFKEFVAKYFDQRTPLYKVLMSEKDEVSREELAGKFDVWLRLVGLSLPAS
jgi:hypothetical protein